MQIKVGKTEVSRLYVSNYSANTKRASLGWITDDARFHIWFNTATLDIEPTIYKNPVKPGTDISIAIGEPGYFKTRRLDLEKHQQLIAVLMLRVVQDGMIQRAIELDLANELAAEQERQAGARLKRIQEAGPALLAALIGVLKGHPDNAVARVEAVDVIRSFDPDFERD